ncbi:MAG: hypothetical protein K6F54_06570 [Lachnospiraceae bacterium]|nr:hypothetical protein [Lachnospiraceae bacterium]
MERKREKQKTAITIVMIVMALAMGALAAIIISRNPRSNTPAFPVFCVSNMFEAVAAGIILAQVIPFEKIGKWVEKMSNAKFPTFRYVLFNSILFALISSIIVNAIVCLVNIMMARSSIPEGEAPPFIMMFLSSYAPLIIPSIIICYVIAIIVTPLVYKILGIKAPKE